MGIIGGIWQFRRGEVAPASLIRALLEVQAHRDNSPSESIYADQCRAFAMRNTHGGDGPRAGDGEARAVQGVYAFVDGIVLDRRQLARTLSLEDRRDGLPSGPMLVAAAYRRWSSDFRRHLDGEFSCAIWDSNRNALMLARDPFGHKPLHFFHDAAQFAFSSEIKGLLATGIPASVNLQALSDFLTLNSVPGPSTPFQRIQQVLPGELVRITEAGIERSSYWSPLPFLRWGIDEEEAVEEVEGALAQSVRRRMSNGPTYCFLSGGLDSSLVVSTASKCAAGSVRAVSVGFEEGSFDEIGNAARLCRHLGVQHHTVICRRQSFLSLLETLLEFHDQPFTDTSAYPTYFAARAAREHTDVVLTGDGPDQLVGGSNHHVAFLRDNPLSRSRAVQRLLCRAVSRIIGDGSRSPLPSLVSRIRRRIARLAEPAIGSAYCTYFRDPVKNYLCTPELWEYHANAHPFRLLDACFDEASDRDTTSRYLNLDVRLYVPNDLMVKVDRMCMAHGLETLSPFQDQNLASILLSLPGSLKLRRNADGGFDRKYILRKIAHNRLPPELMAHPKHGFEIPVEGWLRQDGGRYLQEILLDRRALERGYFKAESIRTLVRSFVTNQSDYYFASAYAMVALLTIELWHRRYIDSANRLPLSLCATAATCPSLN